MEAPTRKKKTSKRKKTESSDEEYPPLKKAATKPPKQSSSEEFVLKKLQSEPVPLVAPPVLESRVSANSNQILVRLPTLDVNRLFTEIMGEANRNHEMLTNLKSMVSSCSRILNEKKALYKKKWAQLRNSHCSQDEYFRRERELKKIEAEELGDVRDDTISKLGYCRIKGFEVKDVALEAVKEAAIQKDKSLAGMEFEVAEESLTKWREEQLMLLEKLMSEKGLISQSQAAPRLSRLVSLEQERREEGEETNYLTEFRFLKHFSELDYDKIFSPADRLLHLDEKDIFRMNKHMKAKLVEVKSDEIYYNESFQAQKYAKYSSLLRAILNNAEDTGKLTQQVVEELLEIATYVLNSVHYYQKFKLSCELLHPLDLIFVVDKLKKIIK